MNRRTQREKEMISKGAIFLALLVVLFADENSTYLVLTKKMDTLNSVMRQIREIMDKMNDLTNKLSEFMQEIDPVEMHSMAQKMSDLDEQLNKTVDTNLKSLRADILKRIKKFFDRKIGSLDDLLEKAQTRGLVAGGACATHEDA